MCILNASTADQKKWNIKNDNNWQHSRIDYTCIVENRVNVIKRNVFNCVLVSLHIIHCRLNSAFDSATWKRPFCVPEEDGRTHAFQSSVWYTLNVQRPYPMSGAQLWHTHRFIFVDCVAFFDRIRFHMATIGSIVIVHRQGSKSVFFFLIARL